MAAPGAVTERTAGLEMTGVTAVVAVAGCGAVAVVAVSGGGTGVAPAVPLFRERTTAAVPHPTRISAPRAAEARTRRRRWAFLRRGIARIGDGAVSTAGWARV